MLTVLHEQAHRGNLLNGAKSNVFTNEDGYNLIDELYLQNPETRNDFYDFSFLDEDWKDQAVKIGKGVIADKKSKKEGEDLPAPNQLGFDKAATQFI
jgi:hypothetical protein